MAPGVACGDKVGLPSSGGAISARFISSSTLSRKITTYSLEHHLSNSLRITNEGSVKKSDSYHTTRRSIRIGRITLTNTKVIMGLVVEQERRESDSPGLPDCMSCPPRQSSDKTGHKDDLVSLAIRTMVLLQRNRVLQQKLSALQLETRALVKSFLPQPPES